MSKLNNKNRLDNSSGIGQDNPNEAMQTASETTKTPWRLRFAPGALNLKEIAATAGIGTIYGLLFASLLFVPLLPHLAAQTSSTNPVAVRDTVQPTQAGGPGFRRAIAMPDGTVYNLTSSTDLIPNGAQVQNIWREIGKLLPWKDWLKWVVGPLGIAVGGNAIWSELNKTWELPPGAASKGRIQSIASIGLWKMDGEKTHWYSKSGEWAWQSQWGFDAKNPLPNPTYPMPLYDLYTDINSDDYDRDYQYFDYWTDWMYWDEDNEIWKSNGDSQHHYGAGMYLPYCINDAHNQGDPGAYYPGHEDYYKGKEGYFITYGFAGKNYLSHEFKSSVVGEAQNADLAAEAKKHKKDKINPLAFVTVSDMTYESDGWKYKRRAPSDVHMVTRELSAVEDTSVDLNDKEYIPLNARHEKTKYENNKCIVYWSARTEWRTEDVQVENLDVIFEDQSIPYRYQVPEQHITDYN